MKTINYKLDKEATAYKGCTYELAGIKIIERTAKITPTKIGQFVTCWKRNEQKITEPYKDSDPIDFFYIKVMHTKKLGVFKFPKKALIQHGILSTEKKDGKRGFRVYPAWDKPTNKQAIKTQLWQLKYFEYD